MLSLSLFASTNLHEITLSFQANARRAQVNENEAKTNEDQKQQDAVRSSGVSLPVARTTGWNSGSSGGHRACKGHKAAGESICLPPSSGGRYWSPPAWATLWDSAHHPPPTPATASTCFAFCPPPVYCPHPFYQCHPLGSPGTLFINCAPPLLASSCLSSSHPLVHSFSRGGDLFLQTHAP